MRKCLLLLVIAVVGAACSTVPTPKPSRFVSLGNQRAYDAFDNPKTSWDVFSLNSDQALFRIQNSVLEGAVIPNQGYIWSLNNLSYNDAAVSATVQQTKGSRGNGFGVMCRANEQGDGYYFVISSAGQFAILKGQAGVADPVRLVGWQSSSAIHQGNEPNTLQAICAGDYLSFSVNGQFLADATDSEFSSGKFGMVLAGVDQTLWVSFDDIIIRDATLVGA